MCSLKKYFTPIFTSLLSISAAITLYAQDPSPTTTTLSSSPQPTNLPTAPTEPPTEPAFTACDSIAAEDLTTEITVALGQLRAEGLQRPNCAILKPSEYDDLTPVINSLPENTTILLAPDSDAANEAPTSRETPPPPATQFNAQRVIDLKNGQHVIGISGDDSDVLLVTPSDFIGRHMVGIGTANSFSSDEQESTVIRGVHFKPFKDDLRDSVDSIIFAQCYNRLLIVDSNTFTLDRRASVFLDCKRSNTGITPPRALLTPTEQMNADIRGGPGLRFINNTVIGDDEHSDNAPDEGVFSYGPKVLNLPEALQTRIESNHFSQSMKVAIEVETGSNVTIHNNTISETLLTETVRNFIGIELIGVTNLDPLPVYNVSANTIGLDGHCIQLKRELTFSFSENQMSCHSPWNQTDDSQPVHVSEIAPGEECATCNTWTPQVEGFSSPCFGLNNLDGDIHFNGFTCFSRQPQTPSASDTTASTTTDSGSAVMQSMPVVILLTTLNLLALLI